MTPAEARLHLVAHDTRATARSRSRLCGAVTLGRAQLLPLH